jgi:Domain of unknown function (DUF4833)
VSTRVVAAAGAVALVATSAISGAVSASPQSLLPSALVIRKSSNKNQVCYAVAVDDACAPLGQDPVRPYWRLLEKGAGVTQALSSFELRYLGLNRQENSGEGVTVALRAMPARSIFIRTTRSAEGQCTSTAETTIGGVPAKLDDIYVKQKLFGIDYVLLTGVSHAGAPVKERIDL